MKFENEEITTARQANLMITDIESTSDVISWTLQMMKAIRAGVKFINRPDFNEVDALANEMDRHCNQRGINTTISI